MSSEYRRPPVSEQQDQAASTTGPLAGVRVVELGLWLAAPACASVLADWGADVIKMEPIGGDPFGGLAWAYGGEMNPPFELDNRGKRSVAVDLRTEGGLEVLWALLLEADVFLSNYRPAGLDRLGLDWPAVHARHPRLIYGSITGYGLEGPERDRASYDMGAYWGRAGVAPALTPPGQALPYQRGGFGDHLTGMSLAGGLSAALYARERTGVGQLVATSLLRAGMYQMGADINTSLRTGSPPPPAARRAAPNPLLTGYRCANEEWIWLLGLEGDRHWPSVAAGLELDHLRDDPRFATMEGRRDHAVDVRATLQERFGSGSRAEWGRRLDAAGVWWAKVQHAHELIDDEQAHAAGGFLDVPVSDSAIARMEATPVDFSGHSRSSERATLELGQDTELMLLDLGWDWERTEAVKQAGAII